MAWVLLNNDFEYPVQSTSAFIDFSNANPGTDWPTTSTGFSGISRGNVPTLNDGVTPPSGSQVAYFYDNGFISQDVASVPAGTYTLSLYARKAGYGGGQNNITFKVDGSTISTFTVSSGSWTQFTSAQFTVASGTRTTRFEGTSSSGGNVVLFDLITLALVSSTASGAVTLGGLTAAGVGGATGAVTLGSLAVAGTATFTASASGAVALGSLTTSGVGSSTWATGAITLGSLAVAGSGTFKASASGSVALAALTVAGVGSSTWATGAITLGALSVSGDATSSAPGTTTGVVDVTLAGLAASGAATFKASASGAVTLGSLAVAGVGTFSTSASGSVALAGLAASGVGTFRATAAGGISLAPMSVSGSASATGGISTGSGSIALRALVVAGDAEAISLLLDVYPKPFAARSVGSLDPFGANSRYLGS